MRFQLVRFFTIASLVLIGLVTVVLVGFEHAQGRFFKDAQDKQIDFLRSIQEDFAQQQDEAARRDLLSIHEAGNVNLTRLFANALWEDDFAPFVAKAQKVSFEHCRAMPDESGKDGKSVTPPNKKACFSDAGGRIAMIPGFKALDAKVFGAMKRSTVFKVKVFDLRGITIYSSEHRQIGEDKSDNVGWQGAALDGRPKSELTHRDRFSAFEGVVEDRDLISSYLPVVQPGSDRIVGVFEVYSDVTPFLAQIKKSSDQIRKTALQNQGKVRDEAHAAQAEVDSSSLLLTLVLVSMMLVLFGALFWIVWRADKIIKQQEKERDNVQQQLAQSEKMASLGQMVAGVAHQLNTPLAFSQSNVELVQQSLHSLEAAVQVARLMAKVIRSAEGDQVVLNIAKARDNLARIEAADIDIGGLQKMLGDVLVGISQMSELVVNLRDFTRLDRAMTEAADLNKSLHTVVYIAKSVIPQDIKVIENYGEIPALECNPSQLNQVFLNLINNAAQAIGHTGEIKVSSALEGEFVKIRVADDGPGIPLDVLPNIFDLYFTTKPAGEGTGLGLSIARDIVRQHGGELTVESLPNVGATFTVSLPLKQAAIAVMK